MRWVNVSYSLAGLVITGTAATTSIALLLDALTNLTATGGFGIALLMAGALFLLAIALLVFVLKIPKGRR